MSGLPRPLQRALLVIALAGSALVAGEIVLRVFFPQLLLWNTSLLWEPVEGLRWRRRPNIDVRINTGDRDARILTDGVRHRVGVTPPPPGEIRILAIGDSMVEAVQVDYEQTMTALLERSLSTTLERRVEVVNAGIGGYDPNQYRMVAQMELRESRYDLILVFVYVENDLIRQRVESYPASTELIGPALRPFEDRPGETMRVLGIRATALLASHSHLFVFAQNFLAYIQGLRFMPASPGMYHPLSAALRSNRDAPEWRTTGEILNDLGVAADQAHVPVVFVLLPSAAYINPAQLRTLTRALRLDPADVDIAQPSERLGEELQKWGRTLRDPAPRLRQAFDAGERDLFGRVDLHFGPAGHQVMAEFLTPLVRDELMAAGAIH